MLTPVRFPGELRIAFVGRLAEEKNVDVLIEALSLLPDTLEHVVLDIAGGGELREALEQRRTIAVCPTA